ncbi:GntR family transcriptional regulator [Lentisphaerota bacterium ZTH]|nr:GntR family transcriptional regulator [Lentisphaerota bacterium]WET05094.1 GntR family transcriptional regulator [Lentisphaerota bacterium ZTH]
MRITIDKNSDMPVYRQIIERVMQQIQNGQLKAGDKLPPERDLAQELGTARGTIKKAYERLAVNHVIQIVHGRGTFVSSQQDIVPASRKETAVKLLNQTIESLEKLNFSHQEVSTMLQLLMMDRQRRLESFHIAGVDCNPEALSIFESQLQHLANVRLHKFPLEAISKSRTCKQLRNFDLILTTTTHYNEICNALPECKDRVIQAVVTPSQQTIIDLATIPRSSNIGVISQSENFYNIINNKLKEFHINLKNKPWLNETVNEDVGDFLEGKTVLITPPKCALEENKNSQPAFSEFLQRGGRIIRFEYQLERTALIRIEEKISELMEKC